MGDADVVVEDEARPRASGEGVLVPAHDTDAGVVAVHAAEFGTLLDIPDLDLAGAEADADVGAVTRPLDATDVGVRAGLQEAAHGAGFGRPDIDVALEADGDLVLRGPVQEVEVVVVDETGGVEDALWGGSDTATELSRGGIGGLERTVVLRAEVDWLG